MQAELIYNPDSGQVNVRSELDKVVKFLDGYGWRTSITETRQPMQAAGIARQAVANGAQVVIAAGGDGTINEVVNGLVNTGVPLGVLPVGTTNSWALQAGIPAPNPMNPGRKLAKFIVDTEHKVVPGISAGLYSNVLLDAARVIIEGQTIAVDVGEIGGRYFFLWTGIGIDATVVESISPREKKILGSWAYILKAIGSSYRYSSTEVKLTVDSETFTVTTPLIVISNIQLYGGITAIGANACLNDGLLDVCVFKGNGFFTFVSQALKVLARQHIGDPRVEYFQCRQLSVESDKPLPVQVDGESFDRTPVTVRVVPGALQVIMPRVLPDTLFR